MTILSFCTIFFFQTELRNNRMPESWLNFWYKNVRSQHCPERQRWPRRGVAFHIENVHEFSVNAECRCLELELLWMPFKCAGKRLCLRTLYRPPSNNLSQGLKSLESVLAEFIPKHYSLAFGTDMNVNCVSKVLRELLVSPVSFWIYLLLLT